MITFVRARLAEHAETAASASIEYLYEEWTAGDYCVDTITDHNIAHPVECTYNVTAIPQHIALHDPAWVKGFVDFAEHLILMRNALADIGHCCGQCGGYAIEIALYDAIIANLAKVWDQHPDYPKTVSE
ncbi:DUF6221 family protein [Nocardia sp. NPDC051833]|uniref:DUF6221 family protein n=1 Tax=Nocardia sp. NPDC051833 TaxID=3155674 RepID=UPI00341E10C9